MTMKKDLLWPSAPGGGADVPGGIAGHVRGAALQDQDGRVAPMVSILGAPTKFRDAFEAFDTNTRWNAVQIAPGDIVQSRSRPETSCRSTAMSRARAIS